ncbi:hypothetical protein DL764_001041 [Monosporascus ibericus]|uniref:Uncharacterized protein n=1 Tax=Monosporascus ibericus TaxID=155417 RepID=A0A4Q4TUG0_9PEZI|nr:hypothetical protein DL764_001041 [Monosporascus ibericus]
MKASIFTIILATALASTTCAAPAPTEAEKPTLIERRRGVHELDASPARDPRKGGGGLSKGGWGKDGSGKDTGKDTGKDNNNKDNNNKDNNNKDNNNKDNNNKDNNNKGSDLPVGEAGSLAWHVAQCDTSMTCNSDADCLPGCAAGCVPSTDGKKRYPPGLAKPTAIEVRRCHQQPHPPLIQTLSTAHSHRPYLTSRQRQQQQRCARELEVPRDPRRGGLGGLGKAIVELLKGLGGKENGFFGDAAVDVAARAWACDPDMECNTGRGLRTRLWQVFGFV